MAKILSFEEIAAKAEEGQLDRKAAAMAYFETLVYIIQELETVETYARDITTGDGNSNIMEIYKTIFKELPEEHRAVLKALTLYGGSTLEDVFKALGGVETDWRNRREELKKASALLKEIEALKRSNRHVISELHEHYRKRVAAMLKV